MRKSNPDAPGRFLDGLNPGSGKYLHALAAEGLFDDPGRRFACFPQDVIPTLDERDARSGTCEELAKFGGDDSSSQHENALRHALEIEDIVAGPCRNIRQARQGGRVYH